MPNKESDISRLVGDDLVDALKQPGTFLLDVRTPSELEELGTAPGYTNIPLDELERRLGELPRDRPILTA